jgi:hypothetical protein
MNRPAACVVQTRSRASRTRRVSLVFAGITGWLLACGSDAGDTDPRSIVANVIDPGKADEVPAVDSDGPDEVPTAMPGGAGTDPAR